MHGKIDVFGLDALVNMAAAAGLRVKLTVSKSGLTLATLDPARSLEAR